MTRIMKDGTVEDGQHRLAQSDRQLVLELHDGDIIEKQKTDVLTSIRDSGSKPGKKRRRGSKERGERKSKDPHRLDHYAPSELVVTEEGMVWLIAGHLAGSVMVYRVDLGKAEGEPIILNGDTDVRYLGRTHLYPRLVKGW